jgi:GT2 family glycosyltransferase
VNADKRLSVVIPTYNRRDQLERTLSALSAQTFPANDFEVIVSIDGSLDGTRDLIAGFPSPFRLSAVERANAGRAAACNLGASCACGEVLLFLDDDMEPAPECLASHFAMHQESRRCAVIGAIPITRSAPSSPVLEFLDAKVESFLTRMARPGYQMVPRDFFSSNFSIRRELFLELGGFDDSFRVYGNEDVELAFRLLGAGVPIVFRPQAVARQSNCKDFAALARDSLDKGRTAVLLVRKHPAARGALKLRRASEFSRKWRFLRAVLLSLSPPRDGAVEWTTRLIDQLERRRPRNLHRVYLFALDYLFWLGVQAASGEAPAGSEPARAVAARVRVAE